MTKYVNNSGVSEMWLNIKNWVTSQLLGYSQTGHTHTKSQITDLDLSNFVDKTSNQIISGLKTFTSVPTVKKDSAGDLLYLIDDTINTSNEDENGFPLTGHTNSLKIRGHDNNMLPCMLTGQVFTNGDTSAELRAYKYKDISSSNSRAIISLRYIYNSNYGIATFSNVSIVTPNVTNIANLGSPPLQWNTTYTRNILIDNDINIASSMINKTSTSGNLAIRSGPYYADGASINLKGKDQTDASGGRAYITANNGTNHTELVIYPTGETKLTIDGTTKNLALQEDVIPLAGSNAISGSLIPATTDAYDLGGSSYQWNNAYIKSLTINGVACGDILTHNVSEFVDVVNSQTIDGVKTFVNSVFIKRSNPFLQIRSTGYVKGVAPSNNYYQGIRFYDDETSNSENHIVGGFETQYSTSGYNISNINCRNYNQNNVHLNYSVGLYVPNDSTRPIQFVPSVNNVINIGSPSYQWNSTYTRHIHIDGDINIWNSVINKTSNSGLLSLRGGTNYADGASINLYGKDYNNSIAGAVTINAYGNSDYTNLYLYPNGTMSVYNNSTATTKNVAMQEDVVPRSGGAVMTGSLLASSTIDNIGFGYGWGNGGTIYTYSPTHSTAEWQGTIRLEPLKTTSNFKTMTLAPDGTWTWNGTACQITSDQRLKQQISEIDDALLDAWEDVELSQFKYNDAVDQKGKDKARLHTGYVVQQIDEACKSHGVDISQYGLYCHEEYPQEVKEIEVEQKDGTKVKECKVIREANEHYSLRYTEALIVECKYLRRCIARLTARIEQLEGAQSK